MHSFQPSVSLSIVIILIQNVRLPHKTHRFNYIQFAIFSIKINAISIGEMKTSAKPTMPTNHLNALWKFILATRKSAL